MRRRLQVSLDEAEWMDIQRIAALRGLSVSDWVRQTLREARGASVLERKLLAVRQALRHSFPIADLEEMNSEIERG